MVDKAYWQSPAVLAHTGAVTQALMHMFMGVFFYDTLLSLPFDWEILTGKRRLRWVHAAYFGTKLSLMGYCAAGLAVTWAQREVDCRAAFWLIEMFMGFTVFTSSLLLAFRTVCVYHGREQMIIKGVVVVFAAALLAVWMQGITDVTAAWTSAAGHAPYSTGMCIIAELKQDYWVKYVVTIVFDATILILTAVGVARMAGTSRVGLVLVQQGIVYFVLTLLANLIITVITLLQLSDAMALSVALPQSVICVLCSCRLYRKLADGSITRSHENSMSGGGVMELDSNGNPLPVSVSSKGGLAGRRGTMQRLFRANSDFSATRSRGAVPSFVSATTANSQGKSPYERYPATPGGASSPKHSRMPFNSAGSPGYFDIAPVSSPRSATRPPPHSANALAAATTPSSRSEELDFVAMLQETRSDINAAPNTPAISFGGLLSMPLSPPPTAKPHAAKPLSPRPHTHGSARKPSPSTLSVSISVEQEQMSEKGSSPKHS